MSDTPKRPLPRRRELVAQATASRLGMLIFPMGDGEWRALFRECSAAFEDRLGSFDGGLSHIADALATCEQDTQAVLHLLRLVNDAAGAEERPPQPRKPARRRP